MSKTAGGRPVDLSWWNYLKWNVSTCAKTNDLNTAYWTFACDQVSAYGAKAAVFGPPCIITIVLVAAVALLILLLLLYAVYRYRSDNERLRAQLQRERQNLQKVDEYYKSLIRERSAKDKEREKTFVDLINETSKEREEKLLNQLQQIQQQPQPQPNLQHPQILPIVIPDAATARDPQRLNEVVDELRELREELRNRDGVIQGNGDLPQNYAGRVVRGIKLGGISKSPPNLIESDYEYEEEPTDSTEDLKAFNGESHLPADHPARLLPPVDVLLLVDASSSIGNNNYELVKHYLREFMNDIDINPGRSRVAAIIFANEPQVHFGFDRYYSIRSVRASLRKMPYLGGPTFLAKALSFAAGVLYQEQNMKSVHRKHKYMPTPRHDRLQVMVVVSDGVSDDNFDKQATQLHEKMLVKIAGVVTKSFNKERLVPITRFDGAVFDLTQREALSIWLWRQQRMWNQNFGHYIEREKSFVSERTPIGSPKKPMSPKKQKK